MDTTYYASPESDTKTAAKKISEIIRAQQQRIYSNQGISKIWKRNSEIYYKNAYCDVLEFVGEQGELVSMSVPQARSLTRQTASIVSKQKLSFKAISRSTDYESACNGKIAEAIANNLVTSQNLDFKKGLIAEQSYVWGQSFWHVEWDASGGESRKMPAEPGTEAQEIKTGEVTISVVHPQYVYYDWNASEWGKLSWVVIAERLNRFDLIAQHPELEKEILALPKFTRKFTDTNSLDIDEASLNDLVLIYKYYHRKSDAVPFGRLVILGSESCVLYDGSNPYECIPVSPVMPELIEDKLLGYPQFSNLAPMQEMLDHNFSVIASNQTAFGVQSILSPRGSNIDVTQVMNLQWIDYTPQTIDGGGKPEPLQLTRTAPELIDTVGLYRDNMAEIANINGALRGTPPAGITAGNALATLTANSIEFLSSFSQCLYKSIEDIMTMSVKFYRMFGAEEQIVSIADGKTMYAQQFKAADLSSFERITLDIVNPTSATYGGRQNDAEQLLAAGLIQDIGTFMRVKEGAPIQTLYQPVLDEQNLIQKENDDLLLGTECPVLITDTHQMHIQHHTALLFNPDIRRNGGALQIILNHIEQHKQFEMQSMAPPPGPPPQSGPPQGAPGPSSAQQQPPSAPAPAQPAKPGATL